MNHVLQLCIFFKLSYLISAFEWPLKKKSFVEGDIILGGFFPIHTWDKQRMCGKLQDEGLIQLDAMLYTVEKINNDTSLLPGLRLGVIAVDSCDTIPKALEEAVDFAKGFVIRDDLKKGFNATPPFTCGGNILPHFQSGMFERVVAIVGGHSSWVSRQVADLMRIYKVPQVSYQSTSPLLSDIGYEYFFRTVPPLNHQMKVITEILRNCSEQACKVSWGNWDMILQCDSGASDNSASKRSFKWKYFAVVYSDSAYGNKGVEVLKKIMLTHHKSLCISSLQRINVENSIDEDYDFYMSELLQRNATAVIVFGDHEMARNLMSAATRARAYKRFVWIGSTAWVGRDYVIKGNEAVMEGALGILHDLKPVNGFDEYLKSRKLQNHQKINPWFPEYWEKNMNCRLNNSDSTPFNGNYSNKCSENAELPPRCYLETTPSVQFVRDAVYSLAYALQDIYKNKCRFNALCLEHRSMIGEEIRKHLIDVQFEDENKNLFKFDAKGDGPPRYTIVNLQWMNESNEFKWMPVGSFDGENEGSLLQMNNSLTFYKYDDPLFPESLCSVRCNKGQAKSLLDGASCCWHCIDCEDYQYVENGTRCVNCTIDELPNLDRTACEPIFATFMDFSDSWAAGCISFSIIGILTTLCVAGVIGKYWDTPIIISSGREFSLIILVGIILSFSLTFAVVSKPSSASCGIVRFFLGLFCTISYATIGAKIHYLCKLNARLEAKKKPKRINTKLLILIILSLIGVESSINAAWLSHSPPSTDYQYPTRSEKVLICKGSDTEGYLVGLLFPFFLLITCTIYASRIRNFKGVFRESRYVNFTNYTILIVWLSFFPVFLLTNINVLRVVVLSLLLNVSALVQLVCLFFPKVYIAVRRPEKNKHDNVMCYDVRQSVNTSI